MNKSQSHKKSRSHKQKNTKAHIETISARFLPNIIAHHHTGTQNNTQEHLNKLLFEVPDCLISWLRTSGGVCGCVSSNAM